MAIMSILGLYNWDDTIFDPIVLPDGVDREVVKISILSECAELETLFPNPDIFKTIVSAWSASMLYKWEKLFNTTRLEYNPIDNYNMTEKEITKTNSNDIATTESESSNTERTKVAAFNEAEEQPRETVTDTANATGNNVVDRNENIDRELTRSGNIGVTTFQRMIESERNVANFSIYNTIVSDFKARFCLMVY